ncbi:MAG TPA: integrin alpha, partial [Planctomycetota bacterium]|nr:integrin alpha [Planctomycetota bacterium]
MPRITTAAAFRSGRRLFVVAAVAAAGAPAQLPTRFTVHGDGPDARLGAAVARAGDVDADGVTDIVVGAPADSGSSLFGAVRIVSGASGAVILTIPAPAPDQDFGASVDGAGDLNADGYADVVIGEPGFVSNGATQRGRVRAYSGVDGSVLHEWIGDHGYDRLGASVAGIGDVNGDGVPDLAATA